jgi:homoserine/homoserine lactone efflux protein
LNLETWLLFFVAYLTITLSPGPNVLLVIKNAVKYDYKAAIVTILSNLFCQLMIVTLVAFGAGTILEKSPMLFVALKLIGGAYLICLGITGLLKKEGTSKKCDVEVKNQMHFSSSKVFKEAFLVSVSNPKTVIFLSAFLPQFISTDVPVGWQFTMMFLTICIIVMSVHLIYSYIAKNINKKWSGLKAKPIFSKITNSAFIAFGFGVLSSSRTA